MLLTQTEDLKMIKQYKNQIEELLALGRRDLEQNGMISIRETIVHVDGKESTFPPPGTNGVSLNWRIDCARLYYKQTMMRMRIEHSSDIVAIFFLHDRVIYELADLEKHPNRQSLYVLGQTIDEDVFVRQDYSIDGSGQPVFGELTVLDHDPEAESWLHGCRAAGLLGASDELCAKLLNDLQAKGYPKEWRDYVYRERQKREEDDDYFNSNRGSAASKQDTVKGGSDEIFDLEETV